MVSRRRATDLQQDPIELHLVLSQAFAQGGHFGQRIFQRSLLIVELGEGQLMSSALGLHLRSQSWCSHH